MIQLPLNAQFVTNASGERISALIPIKEYEAIVEELELKEDIQAYLEAKALNETPIPIEQAFAMLDSNQKAA